MQGELTFRPTYKMDPLPVDAPAVTEPRRFSELKDRCPSWTDRILLRPLPGHQIKVPK